MKKLLVVMVCSFFMVSLSVAVQAAEEGAEKGSAMMKEGKGSSMGSSQGSAAGSQKGSMAQEESKGATAIALISGTQEGSDISGAVHFQETNAGLKVIADLSGVPDPGKHGFHVHQYGSCGNEGKSAGGHYNPSSVKHGYLPTDGPDHAHFGDMGNLEVDEEGNGKLVIVLPGLTVNGTNNVSGRAVILHAKEDDFGQPTGNAGSRIGCGTIAISSE